MSETPYQPDHTGDLSGLYRYDAAAADWRLYVREPGEGDPAAPASAERDPAADQDLCELLRIALDTGDAERVRLLSALVALSLDLDREAELARLSRDGLPPLFRP